MTTPIKLALNDALVIFTPEIGLIIEGEYTTVQYKKLHLVNISASWDEAHNVQITMDLAPKGDNTECVCFDGKCENLRKVIETYITLNEGPEDRVPEA